MKLTIFKEILDSSIYFEAIQVRIFILYFDRQI